MKNIIFLILLINSCGSEQEKSAVPQEKETKSVQTDELSSAELIDSEENRPECSKKQLIYVVDKKEFQSCSGSGSGWEKIEITKTEIVKKEIIEKQTINNITNNSYTYQGMTIYTDDSGKEYFIMRAVQKKKVKNICNGGFSPATKSDIEKLTSTDFWTALNKAYPNMYLLVNAVDGDNITLGLPQSNNAPVPTWSMYWYGTNNFPSGYVESAVNVICTK